MNNWRPLFELAESAIEHEEEYLLATVVRLDGSGYGRPGAKLLMTSSGERAGYVSGGCLEKDLCQRAWTATEQGPKLIAFDTRGNSVDIGKYNTGCDGVVFVLCQRFHGIVAPVLVAMRQAAETGEAARCALVYRSDSDEFPLGMSAIDCSEGSTIRDPQRKGAPGPDRSALLEIARGSHQTKSVVTSDGTGAAVEIFVEVIEPSIELLIFGTGDDVLPLHDISARLGWRMTIVGRRPELANSARFPRATVHCGFAEQIAPSLAIGENTCAVLMTHDFELDSRLLPVLLDSPARHIGILGPKRRLGKLVWRLAARGRAIRDDETERIHAPLGLDIGATCPEEIAISLVAEIISRRRNRAGGFLHDRLLPLNAPHVMEKQRATAFV